MSDGFVTKPNYDTLPIGTVLQSPLNLEAVTQGKWIMLDGRDCNRGDYPELAQWLPNVGTFTSTSRTLPIAPSFSSIAADSNCFLVAANATTGQGNGGMLNASADGTSWVAVGASWTNSTPNSGPQCILYTGTTGNRFVIAGANGDLVAPYVISTTTGTYGTTPTPANLVNKANWTATTGGLTVGTAQSLAYGNGVTVLMQNGSQTTAASVKYLADGATAWSSCSGGSTNDKQCIAFTGSRFIIVTTITQGYPLTLLTSTAGAVWADEIVPFSGGGAVNSIASNGNGVVIMCVGVNTALGNSQPTLLYSKDHGYTWSLQFAPMDIVGDGSTIRYVNGKFMLYGGGLNFAFSTDGKTWLTDSVWNRGALTTGVTIPASGGMSAYKNGTYCHVVPNVKAMTYTENLAKFRLPMMSIVTGYSVNNLQAGAQAFIKARS